MRGSAQTNFFRTHFGLSACVAGTLRCPRSVRSDSFLGAEMAAASYEAGSAAYVSDFELALRPQRDQFELVLEEDDEKWPNGHPKWGRMTTTDKAKKQYVGHIVRVNDRGLVDAGTLRNMGLEAPDRKRGSGKGKGSGGRKGDASVSSLVSGA